MISPKPLCLLDVLILGFLFSATDEVDFETLLSEIDPVTGSEIKFQFRNPLAYGFRSAKIARLYSIDTNKDSCPDGRVKTEKPLSEWFSTIACLTDEISPGSRFQAFYRPLQRVTLISRERIARLNSSLVGRNIML